MYFNLRAPVRTTRQDAPAQKATRSITLCRTLLYTNLLDSATVNYTKGWLSEQLVVPTQARTKDASLSPKRDHNCRRS